MNLLPILTCKIKDRACDWAVEGKGRAESFRKREEEKRRRETRRGRRERKTEEEEVEGKMEQKHMA